MPSGIPIKGENDLLSQYPNLVAKFWDFKNNTNQPCDVRYTSGKKCYWICPKCHNSYLAKVCDRIVRKSDLCNECAGYKSIKTNKTLKEVYPKIVKYWDYDANKKGPEQYAPQSNKIVNWICRDCGYHYSMQIQSRVLKGNKYTCPVCTHRVLKQGVNDLVTVCNEKGFSFYKDWDYEKNGDKRPESYFPQSEEKVWWVCHNNKYRPHSFYASISSRYNNALAYGEIGRFGINGCNICYNRVLVQGINDFVTICKDEGLDLLDDWDFEANGDLLPQNVTVGCTKEVNWKCHICGHKWKRSVHDRIKGYGCSVCITSKNEKLIHSLLNKWNLDVRHEYPLTTLGEDFYYDFFVYNKRVFIEYDGAQHFKVLPWFDKSTPFKERIRHDNVKNSFAFQNNIPLLRIPYIYNFDKNKTDIARLLKEFIHTRKIPQEIIDFYKQYEFSNYAELASKWNFS